MGEAKIKTRENMAMQNLIGGKSCRSCEFRLKLHTKLHCRRYPPQNIGGLAPGERGQPVTLFVSSYPETNPDLPCGEYRRSELHAAEELRDAGQGMIAQ